ncbi:hypothetical protein ACVTW2_000654 [Escherichia coli]
MAEEWGVQYYSEQLGKMVNFTDATAYQYMDLIEVGHNKGIEGWSITKTYDVPTGGTLVALANNYTILLRFEYDPDDVAAEPLNVSVSGNSVTVEYDEGPDYNPPETVGNAVHVFCKMPPPSSNWGIQNDKGDFSLISSASQGLFLKNRWSGVTTVNGMSSVNLGITANYGENLLYMWTSNGNAVVCFHAEDYYDDGDVIELFLDNGTNDTISNVQWYICEFEEQAPTKSEWGFEIYNDKGEACFTTAMVPFQMDQSVTLPGGWGNSVSIDATAMVPVTITGLYPIFFGEDYYPYWTSMTNNGGKLTHAHQAVHEYGSADDWTVGGQAVHLTNYTNYF